jgi:hypothetical protein
MDSMLGIILRDGSLTETKYCFPRRQRALGLHACGHWDYDPASKLDVTGAVAYRRVYLPSTTEH